MDIPFYFLSGFLRREMLLFFVFAPFSLSLLFASFWDSLCNKFRFGCLLLRLQQFMSLSEMHFVCTFVFFFEKSKGSLTVCPSADKENIPVPWRFFFVGFLSWVLPFCLILRTFLPHFCWNTHCATIYFFFFSHLHPHPGAFRCLYFVTLVPQRDLGKESQKLRQPSVVAAMFPASLSPVIDCHTKFHPTAGSLPCCVLQAPKTICRC